MTQSGRSRNGTNLLAKPEQIPWKQITVEGVAVVVSILLAFWIDAWWEDRQERLEGKILAGALASEVIEHSKLLDEKIVDSNEHIEMAEAVLDVIAGVEPIETRRRGIADIGSIFIMYSWYLTDNVYQQSVASGKLLFIQDEELRFMLADYHSRLADLVALLASIESQYFLQLEPFLVKHTIYTEVAYTKWLKEIPAPPFKTDFDALTRNTELWNLLAFRLELELAYLAGLETARESGSNLSEALLVYANQ